MEHYSQLLPPSHVQELVSFWLKEDAPHFDVGGMIVGDNDECAVLMCKSTGVLAGVPFFDCIFHRLGCTVQWNFPEGSYLEKNSRVAIVSGKARCILLGERVALNCLSRASGVATLVRKFIDKAKRAEWKGKIAGTRKTTPGFRLVEKYALYVGGADAHRYDLSSMIMLKDNHLWNVNNVTEMVRKAKNIAGRYMKIEVECRTMETALEAIEAGADIIMLDNFTPEAIHSTAKQLKMLHPRICIEASGGIDESNVDQYFDPYVDVVSSGSLTQNYFVTDFSLKLIKEGVDPLNPLVT